jgi:hypothetical protein
MEKTLSSLSQQFRHPLTQKLSHCRPSWIAMESCHLDRFQGKFKPWVHQKRTRALTSYVFSSHIIHRQAFYGDVGTHKQSVLPNCNSYIHRFGPGMILYFFGHAPLSLLGDADGDLVIQGWDLPKSFMWPTGRLNDSDK